MIPRIIRRFLLSLVLSLVFLQVAFTQVRQLSLEESIELARLNNYDIQLAEQQAEVARSQFMQANAVFLPQLSIEENIVNTTDPISAFGIKLRQKSITAADFNPVILNDPDDISNFNTRIQVQQPILNLDGIFERKAAQNFYKSSQKNADFIANYQVFLVKENYFRLLLLEERVSVVESSLKLAKEVEKQASDYYKQGLINKAEWLQAQVQVKSAEDELLTSQNAYQKAVDDLSLLIGEALPENLQLTSNLVEEAGKASEIDYVGLNNSGLQAMELQLEAAKENLKSSRFNFVPSLNAFGSYEFNDDQLLGLNNSNYTIGASLKWNLFKGSSQINEVKQRQAELRSMRIRYDHETEKLMNGVKNAERALSESAKKMELNQLAAMQAEEDFKIRSNRYEQGLEKTSDLLMSETQFKQKQLMWLQSRYAYQVNAATLEYLTETNL